MFRKNSRFLTLLQMRLAMRRMLPCARWSLAPPFHPCSSALSQRASGLFSVALSVERRVMQKTQARNLQLPHFPRLLPGIFSGGARTFPHRQKISSLIGDAVIFLLQYCLILQTLRLILRRLLRPRRLLRRRRSQPCFRRARLKRLRLLRRQANRRRPNRRGFRRRPS